MPVDRNPSLFNAPPSLAAATITSVPQYQLKTTTVNLNGQASVDLDFTIDVTPWLDMFVFMDQAGIVRLFTREGSSGIYRQLGADYPIVASVLTQPITRLRIPGSQLRVRLINNAAAGAANATTVLVEQIHARSL